MLNTIKNIHFYSRELITTTRINSPSVSPYDRLQMDLLLANNTLNVDNCESYSILDEISTTMMEWRYNKWVIVNLIHSIPLNIQLVALIMFRLLPIVGLFVQFCPSNFGCTTQRALEVKIIDHSNYSNINVSIYIKYNSSYIVNLSTEASSSAKSSKVNIKRDVMGTSSLHVFLALRGFHSTIRQEDDHLLINGLKKSFTVDLVDFLKTPITFQVFTNPNNHSVVEKYPMDKYIKYVATSRLDEVQFVESP